MLFKTGCKCMTNGVMNRCAVDADFHRFVLACMKKHCRGDWGCVGAEDWALNDASVKAGERILSAYEYPTGEIIWIITEWDRSVTTVLFPYEY